MAVALGGLRVHVAGEVGDLDEVVELVGDEGDEGVPELVGRPLPGVWMASKPTVRWNESAGRWMAWVRFPDGARRKVERVDKAAAQRDLDELLSLRAQALEPPPRRQQAASLCR